MTKAARRLLALVVVGCLGPATAHAVDIGVKGLKLILIDKYTTSGKAKAVFVSKDPGIVNGSGSGDPADLSGTAKICPVADPSNSAVYDLPSPWSVNKTTVAKYVNKFAAPAAAGVKVTVAKPGKVLKVVGKNLGDGDSASGDDGAFDLNLNDPPGTCTIGVGDDIDVEVTIVDAATATTYNQCARFTVDIEKSIAGGTGCKLVSKTSVPGPCRTCVVCGDGILDVGEACDASVPGGDAACPGACLPPAVVAGDPECICCVDPTPAIPHHRSVVYRPVIGGVSAYNSVDATCTGTGGFIATGTLGAVVHPTGAPATRMVLGNSHVFARTSDNDPATTDDPTAFGCLGGTPETTAGEPLMQPGTLDGGTPGIDDIGGLPPFVLGALPPSLDPYEPICFPPAFCPGAPGFPAAICNGASCVDAPTENCIDAGIGLLTVAAAIPPVGSESILDIGPNAGFAAPIGAVSCKDADVDLSVIGRIVKKSGRTTGFTWGRITGIIDAPIGYSAGSCSIASGNGGEDCVVDADCPLPVLGACVVPATGYGVPVGTPSAPFVNQLKIEPEGGLDDFSLGGDSGSLILTGTDEPVGLLFAGAPGITLANPIKPVLSRFGIDF